MPKLNKSRVQHRMAELDVTSTRQFAEETDIPWGSLKNGLAGRDPLTLNRIYRIANRLKRRGEHVTEVVADILANNNEGVPEEPPAQPKPQPRPKPRDKNKGPKRIESDRGAA